MLRPKEAEVIAAERLLDSIWRKIRLEYRGQSLVVRTDHSKEIIDIVVKELQKNGWTVNVKVNTLVIKDANS